MAGSICQCTLERKFVATRLTICMFDQRAERNPDRAGETDIDRRPEVEGVGGREDVLLREERTRRSKSRLVNINLIICNCSRPPNEFFIQRAERSITHRELPVVDTRRDVHNGADLDVDISFRWRPDAARVLATSFIFPS